MFRFIRIAALTLFVFASAFAQSNSRASYSALPRRANDGQVPTATPLWRLNARLDDPYAEDETTVPNPHVTSDGKRVFYLQKGKVNAVDARTGQRVWSFGENVFGPLEVGADRLFVSATREGTLHALEAGTGRVLWRRTRGRPLTYLHAGWGALFAIDDYNQLTAYDLATGKERWRVNPLGTSYEVFFAKGVVILPSTTLDAITSTSMHAYDEVTGRYLWKAEAHHDVLFTDTAKAYLIEEPFPIVNDYPGRLKVSTYDLRTGRLLGERDYDINDGPGGEPNPDCFWDVGRALVYKGFLYV